LIFHDTNYKRSAHLELDSASIESQVLQQCKSRREIRRQFVAWSISVPALRRGKHQIIFVEPGF
jgi:hypothetical protein